MPVDSFYASLADPPGSSALTAAVEWLEGTLLGTIATTVAIIAIASVGLGLLTGRIDLRRGMTVVIGCFILFGASTIVAGIRSSQENVEPIYVAPSVATPPPAATSPRLNAYDPYAGMSRPAH